MGNKTVRFTRTKQVWQTEGLMPLLRWVFTSVISRFFAYRTFYLYEHIIENDQRLREADFTPKIDNTYHRIVTTNKEANALEAEGFEFRSQAANARVRLDNGAIAFCIFVGRELANIVWVAMTQQAKDSLKEPPFKVDFSENEAWSGGAWTNPKYRRMGLIVYGDLKRRQFMLDKGIVISRYVAAKRNIGPQKAIARIGPRVYAEGRQLRILWWKSWKEKPLT